MATPGPFSKPPATPIPIGHRATPEKVEPPYRAPRVSQQPTIQNKVMLALVAGILVILVGWSIVALRDRAQAREAARALAIARIDADLKACIAEGHRQQVVETAEAEYGQGDLAEKIVAARTAQARQVERIEECGKAAKLARQRVGQ